MQFELIVDILYTFVMTNSKHDELKSRAIHLL